MKINGQKIDGPAPEVVVIPRGDSELVIKAKPVLDFESFEKINPVPIPPKKMFPGGVESVNVEDPTYKKKLEDWAQQKSDWMILQSLSATEGLEWENVDVSDPKTWKNFREELSQTFTPGEVAKIIEIVMVACGLNQDKIEEATKRFLATQARQ